MSPHNSGLLFKGSGPGALDGFEHQFLHVKDKRIQSLRPPFAISCARAVKSGSAILASTGIGTSRQDIVVLPVDGGPPLTLLTVLEAAVLYPTLSPNGSVLAFLLVQGRFDHPPAGSNVASLVSVPVPALQEQAITYRVGDLRLRTDALAPVPIEWSSENTILLTRATSTDMEIVQYDIRNESLQSFARGVFPRISADGSWIAYIRKRAIVLRPSNGSPEIEFEREWTPAWLAWHPDEPVLAFAESGPLWKARLSVIRLSDHAVLPLHGTARIAELSWLVHQPAWKSFPDRVSGAAP